jgi:hypothetical protein
MTVTGDTVPGLGRKGLLSRAKDPAERHARA